MTEAALEAALAQIDRAFGKEAGEQRARESVKVWTDPFTEELVLRYVRDRVEGILEDEDGGSPLHGDFWLELSEEMERGEHRTIHHPRFRMWPPFTFREDVGLQVRRLLGWFQRAKD